MNQCLFVYVCVCVCCSCLVSGNVIGKYQESSVGITYSVYTIPQFNSIPSLISCSMLGILLGI